MTTKIEVFSTDSCPHCPGAIRLAEDVKQELGDIDLEIVKIDNEENRQRAIEYGIMAVPTIVINNQVEFTGTPSKEDLLAKINSL